MNLSRAKFDEAFILSSDERSLFLVHNRIPPSRVCSAMTKAKNVAIDTVIANADGRFSHHEMALVSAITTLYMIEVNHILRVYRLFERGITPEECHYEFREPTADRLPEGYTPPTTNAQMTLPELSTQGSIQLF